MRCIVRGCGNRSRHDEDLCFSCYDILSEGILKPSTAWFVTELDFLHEQNAAAMEQVRVLHAKLNEEST